MSNSESDILSRLLSGSSTIFLGSLVNKFISFIASIFMAQLLGDTGYGEVALSLSVYFVLSSFLSLGMGQGIARNYPRAETQSEQRGYLVSGFQLGVLLSLLGGGILFISAESIAVVIFQDPAIGSVLQIFAVALPFKVLFDLSIGGLQALRKSSIKAVVSSIIQPVIRFSFIIGLVLLGYEAAGVAASYAIATGVVAVLSFYYVYKHTSILDFGAETANKHRELVVFSVPLIGSTIVFKLMNNMDTILVGRFAASADVGQYNIAFVLGMTTLLIYQSIGFMYVPEISELHSEGDLSGAKKIYQAMTKWVVLASAPFILTALAFPEQIITLIYSPEFRRAGSPFVVLVLGFCTHILVGQNKNTLMAFGETRLIFVIDAAMVVLNLVMNVILIPEFGIMGAATATAGSYLLRNIGMSWWLYKSYQIHPFSRWMVRPLVTVIAASVLLWRLIPDLPTYLIPVYTAVVVCIGVLGYLWGGIEDADMRLARLIEDKSGVRLDFVRRLHRTLR